jgi:hypothetical protein
MRRLNLLELGDELGFTSWVAVGMIPQSQLSEGLADVVLVGRGGHSKVCVVISSDIGLHHGYDGGGSKGLHRA